jgi:glycerophosphoryl diester phosphodiesterase
MQSSPIVIGHRGACGYRPEHTLESYRLGAHLGADYIEPDLVTTADGVLVARHEAEIGETTDVADRPEFASRRTTKTISGRTVTGWFAEDFTLAELKTLRARERIPDLRPQNTAFDGRFEIPTFREILELREQLSQELGREIGVYPETKHPTHYRALGLALEAPLVDELRAAGLSRADAPVFLQSFETGNLRDLDRMTDAPIIQLLPTTDDSRPTLAEIAEYAEGVGPAKSLVTPEFVREAHAAGLLVHPFTFRRENQFLPEAFRSSQEPTQAGDLAGELRVYIEFGIDGFFTDNPDIGAAAC